jgi:hypothetical protein
MDGACIRVEEARAFRVVHKGSYDGQTLPSTKVLKAVYWDLTGGGVRVGGKLTVWLWWTFLFTSVISSSSPW